MCTWIAYVCILCIYTKRDQYKKLYYMEFGFDLFTDIFFCLATVLFAMAHNRILRIEKLLVDPRNKTLLHQQKKVSGFSLIMVSSVTAVMTSEMIFKGSLGPESTALFIIEGTLLLLA